MTSWSANLIYLLLYLLLAPWLIYRQMVHGRPLGNWRERLLGLTPRRRSDRRCVWIHAVSVGEVNQLATLLDPLRARLADWDIVLSTTTATGRELAEKKFPTLTKFYFPIDFSWAVRNALRRIQPDLILLTELEVWPNLISISVAKEIPIAVINGRLSQSSFNRYWRFRWLVRSSFAKLNLVAAQNETYAGRFRQLGTSRHLVKVTGSIKYDAAISVGTDQNRMLLKNLSGLGGAGVVWVAGSTQEPEESIVARVYLSLKRRYPHLRLAMVPRHPHRAAAVSQELTKMGLQVFRRTEFGDRPAPRDCVVLIDVIGELNDWWNIGQIAFVGGSFGQRGGQNMIEPALAGCAVCFGPNTWNFAEVVSLMKRHDVATEVNDSQQLERFVGGCLTRPEWARDRGLRARTLVIGQRGASEKIADLVKQLVSSDAARQAQRAA